MAKQVLSIPMSQIIAADAPLLSPVSMNGDESWGFSPTQDNFTYAYYNLPPSPPLSTGSPTPASQMLKMRTTSDPAPDAAQLCLPTHQLFDFPEVNRPPRQRSRSRSLSAEVQDISNDPCMPSDSSSCGSKRSASPGPAVAKKRAIGERISSKDFIPPDVSGLSKREARLVKNRAAAFLSRQRKREEFECMEVRVAELEQENARLLALTLSGSPTSPPQIAQPEKLVSEVEQLKAQLAAAEERERTLSAQLASKSPRPVKVEATEPQFTLSSPSRPMPVPSTNKSGASLGLMVLLCALPSLLSMRMQSTAPTSFAIPNPFPTSSAAAFDYNTFMPSDYDWSKTTGSSLMDLDVADHRDKPSSTMRKLEFTGIDSSEMGLGDLDISFDTAPSDDGKIRVRIHPSSSASSRAATPGASPSSEEMNYHQDMASSSFSSLAMWSGANPVPSSSAHASFSSQTSSFSTSSSDPFLGISNDFGMPFASDGTIYGNHMADISAASLNYGQMSDPSFGSLGPSEYCIPDSTSANGKRRVRIALKSMPQAGGEGGEWEVQIC